MKKMFLAGFGVSLILMNGIAAMAGNDAPATTPSDHTAGKMPDFPNLSWQKGEIDVSRYENGFTLSGYDNADGEGVARGSITWKDKRASRRDDRGYGGGPDLFTKVLVYGGDAEIDFNLDSNRVRRLEMNGPIAFGLGTQSLGLKDNSVVYNENTGRYELYDKKQKPYGTAQLDFFRMTPVLKFDNRLKSKVYGLETSMGFSVHGATKFVIGNPEDDRKNVKIPFDGCLLGKIGLIAGAAEIQGQTDDWTLDYLAKACAGVGLGPVGHLGASQSISGLVMTSGGGSKLDAVSEVMLSKRFGGKARIGVGAAYEYSSTGGEAYDSETSRVVSTGDGKEERYVVKANLGLELK